MEKNTFGIKKSKVPKMGKIGFKLIFVVFHPFLAFKKVKKTFSLCAGFKKSKEQNFGYPKNNQNFLRPRAPGKSNFKK